MKDYYQILGVSEKASKEEIKKAFRKLAFQHHPDTSSGDKQQAEERFKEINEAYGVLGDDGKRQQYDFARNGRFAGVGQNARYGGFQYSQQDIFRDIFTNQTMYEEMNRMFNRAGLRFDQDFLNSVFFRGRGMVFQYYSGPRIDNRRLYRYGNGVAEPPYQQTGVTDYQPGWLDRLFYKTAMWVSKLVLRTLFGIQSQPAPKINLDQHMEIWISPAEAASGGEKAVSVRRDGKAKKLMVKIPCGVKQGTKIRLRDAVLTADEKKGDLYLHVKITD